MKAKKNKSIFYAIFVIVFILALTLFGEKLNTDSIENLFSNVLDANSVETVAQNVSIDDQQNIEQELDISTEAVEEENLLVHYFDVGQADSILVQSDGKNMLIDAGTNEKGKTVVKYLQELGIQRIDYLIGTHPHEDHIGGLDDVINNFEIGTIYMPKVQTNTKTFEDVLDAISNKGLKITSPEEWYVFEFGNAKCEIMNCGTGTNEEKNNLNLSSIVIRVTYGEQSFLFMGDAEVENEASRHWPKINVLKVGHHGSDTSSSEEFLKQVQPDIAIISVGAGNTYGHPKQTTINKLNEIGAKVYRTDENGTITITCDGTNNIINIEK